jgi:alpha-L-fucosidase
MTHAARDARAASVESPAKRDLVEELAAACDRAGLRLFLYYSYAADWRHPYFFPRSAGSPLARPLYQEEPPEYLWREDADSRRYLEFVHAQLEELLTQYGATWPTTTAATARRTR